MSPPKGFDISSPDDRVDAQKVYREMRSYFSLNSLYCICDQHFQQIIWINRVWLSILLSVENEPTDAERDGRI